MTERRKPMNQLLKDDYVDLIRKGSLRFDAANKLGVTVAQVQSALRNDPDFRADLEEALLEATEPVENALYEAAKAGEPWAVKQWLQARDKERWGPPAVKVQITHELDGSALLESVSGLLTQLEERKQHARAIETGGTVVEIAPVQRYEHPVVYGLGKAPVMTNPAIKKLRDTRGMPRRLPGVEAETVASPLLNELPPRPGVIK